LSAQIVATVQDPRRKPGIPMPVLLKAGRVMFWSRLGSLNALEEHRRSRFWKQWLGRWPAGADTMGRVYARLAPNDLRKGLHHLYSRLKRNKALPSIDGLDVAVLDGHETHAVTVAIAQDASSGRSTPSRVRRRSTTMATSPCSC